MSPDYAIYIPWDVWIVSWVAAAIWANRTLKRPGGGREVPYFILEIGGFIMLLGIVDVSGRPASANPLLAFLATRYWTLPPRAAWAMVVLGCGWIPLLLVGAHSPRQTVVRPCHTEGRPPHRG